MPRQKGKQFRKRSYSQGYNDRDNPKLIPFESAQSLQNAYPNTPNPIMRKGITEWSNDLWDLSDESDVRILYPMEWRDENGFKLLFIASDGNIYYITESGNKVQFGPIQTFNINQTFSHVRVLDIVILVTGTSSHIIQWNINTSTFDLLPTGLPGPSSGAIGVSQVSGSNISQDVYVSYSYTFIRRTDQIGNPGGTPILQEFSAGHAFVPGDLESNDDLNTRDVYFNAVSQPSSAQVLFGSTPPSDATHLRIYRTLEFQTEAEAQGAEHRWIADVPFAGTPPTTYTDTNTNAAMAGNLNFSQVIGFDALPLARCITYHLGLVWVGSASEGETVGRWYYSEPPRDIESPKKWFTLFNVSANFKDTSLENSDPCSVCTVSNNNVYLISQKSVYHIPDGNPDFEPRLTSETLGTEFTNTLERIDENIYYISREGPAVIDAGGARLVIQFTAKELWPRDYRGAKGDFHALADKTQVWGWYFNETYFIAYNGKVVGFYRAPDGNGFGPWELVPSPTPSGANYKQLQIDWGIAFDDAFCVAGTFRQLEYVDIAETIVYKEQILNFLDNSVNTDLGQDFYFKSKSKAIYYDPERREIFGEMVELMIFANYTDDAPMNLRIISDFLRYDQTYPYQNNPDSQLLQAPGADVSFSHVKTQPIMEGLIGTFFEIEVEKKLSTPFDFFYEGFTFESFRRDGIPIEFSSQDIGENVLEFSPNIIFYGKFKEDSDSLEDFSPYNRDHAYNQAGSSSRTFDDTLIPEGGQVLVADSGSGYDDADWEDLDFIGDNQGFNSSDRWWEIIDIVDLSQDQTLKEGGDGTNYYRLKYTSAGVLEFTIYTEDAANPGTAVLNYRFYTAAVLTDATEYTIQFELSNGGLNGRFFYGERTGEFFAPVTQREGL